mmetsp:Transcript_39481/g.84265  ORF Transcript_39481/g.84265 Transcript_39481/m.84265 type:complete len:80 (-) Transcript_39481:161-400(-)
MRRGTMKRRTWEAALPTMTSGNGEEADVRGWLCGDEAENVQRRSGGVGGAAVTKRRMRETENRTRTRGAWARRGTSSAL